MIDLVRGITDVVSSVFDRLVSPFVSEPWLGMIALSVITSAWALLLFKWATPQQRLDTTRDRLFGHIYEMGLYQDHLGVLGRVQGRMALANLRYLSLTLPALLALLLPMILTLGQLDGRFGLRPLHVGEETVLTITLQDDRRDEVRTVNIETPEGVRVAAGPVRNKRTGTVAWRLEATGSGPQELRFTAGGRTLGAYTLRVGEGLPLLHDRTETSAWNLLLYPGSLKVREADGVAAISVQWPERRTTYLGLEMHWLLAFMVFSLLGGLWLKGPLRVSF